MTKRTKVAASRVAPLLRAGLIAGVLLAGFAYPLAALGGLGMKGSADFIRGIPKALRQVAPAQTSYVYAADGRTPLAMFYEEYRKYTPISEMSPNIQQAIVAAEDARFFKHHGVDTKGVARAFVANQQAGGVSQGASTLTMQYVRMALRDSAKTPTEVQAATEQTSARKIREMRFATELEKHLNKEEIMERYLNSAYFGHRAYGIFAGAQIFFSKLPKDLTVAESAMLAGLVKAPSAYDPVSSDQEAATARRNYVIDRMAALDFLTPDAAEQAKQVPIELKLSTAPSDCISLPKERNSWGFFCDYFKAWWTEQPAFGDSPAERGDQLRRGGYKVVTTIEPEIQQIAEEKVMAKESMSSRFAHGTVVVQPGTGHVKAMAVNRIYSLDQSENGAHSNPDLRGKTKGTYPNTVNPLLGGGDMPGYQAGSTFKMFTLLAALENGNPLSTSYDSPFRYKSIYDGAAIGNACDGRWCPTNASAAMTGVHSMWSGFGKSVNTYFVQLVQRVGAEKVVRMAERLGLQWRTDVDKRQAAPGQANKWGAFTLGVSDVMPLEMATAYAAVAADGRYCEALPVLSVVGVNGQQATYRTEDGEEVEVAKPRCSQAFSQDVARAATDAARCPVGDSPARGSCGGWSTADSVRGTVGRPVAGKTGTTDSTRSAWFAGYTPELSAASFIADPDNPFNAVGDGQSNKPIDSVAETLRDALKDKPVREFTPPSSAIV